MLSALLEVEPSLLTKLQVIEGRLSIRVLTSMLAAVKPRESPDSPAAAHETRTGSSPQKQPQQSPTDLLGHSRQAESAAEGGSEASGSRNSYWDEEDELEEDLKRSTNKPHKSGHVSGQLMHRQAYESTSSMHMAYILL